MKVFINNIINHPYLYISALERSSKLPWLIFVHGGPGLNCGTLERLIEKDGIFDSLNFNVILYDQRNCGRSNSGDDSTVMHADNIADLHSVITILHKDKGISPVAIIGHSYGAKLLFDYMKETDSKLPSVFLSTASSILIPRVNNLLLDLAYLKTTDRGKYQKILKEFDNIKDGSIWEMTEKLSSIFHENKNRPNFYWANLDWKDTAACRQKEESLPMNARVFTSVRQDLYSRASNYSVDISSLKNSHYLWINGFHDFIMDGQASLSNPSLKTVIFYKSAHYPHIEEPERFCEEVNAFINS